MMGTDGTTDTKMVLEQMIEARAVTVSGSRVATVIPPGFTKSIGVPIEDPAVKSGRIRVVTR
ncbi:hypothetical protein HMPREF0494_1213 [Limosilactobacillus antri DSM 16041]|uniref:Uncharacterized protein n=1 Tax=Limosilactobacillus antri DSM 16041 TaxID=525309 RepID=C8P7B9_9LACO|nr:hypothetical protein HMPREF0494_1213 [Limosilactobacillus antri DSM 16041]